MIARDLIQIRPTARHGTARHGTARHGDGARATCSPSGRWLLGPALMCVLLIATVGCDSRATATSTSPAPTATETDSPAAFGAVQEYTSQDGTRQYMVDAGVIFVDEASYRCIPLAEFGIESADQIKSIETSCECLQASTVTYYHTSPGAGEALKLDFVDDASSFPSGPRQFAELETDSFRPISLAAVVTIALPSEETIELSVEFLHTLEAHRSDKL